MCVMRDRGGWPMASTVAATVLILVSSVAADVAVEQISEDRAAAYELDRDFYKKCVLAQGILIVSSERVSDHALREAAYQFDMVMKRVDDRVAQRIRERKCLCIIIGHEELTSQLPQFKTKLTGEALDFYNWRQRGFLRWQRGRPVVLFSEEDVLEYEGGMQLESILIHEFGHVIHGAGFDKALQDRLTQTYKQAIEKGLWRDGRAAQRFRRVSSDEPVSLFDALVKAFPDESPELIKRCLDGGDILVNGKPARADVKVTKKDNVLIVFGGEKICYAAKNRAEYFAEGVQCWFNTNRTMDHDHNHIHTREQLKEYDPGLAKLCEDALGDDDWRFVSPRDRAGKAHLTGYEPKTSPTVQQPDHIREAALDYYDKYWRPFWKRLYDKHGVAYRE